jgi:hypothetical protein
MRAVPFRHPHGQLAQVGCGQCQHPAGRFQTGEICQSLEFGGFLQTLFQRFCFTFHRCLSLETALDVGMAIGSVPGGGGHRNLQCAAAKTLGRATGGDCSLLTSPKIVEAVQTCSIVNSGGEQKVHMVAIRPTSWKEGIC